MKTTAAEKIQRRLTRGPATIAALKRVTRASTAAVYHALQTLGAVSTKGRTAKVWSLLSTETQTNNS